VIEIALTLDLILIGESSPKKREKKETQGRAKKICQ